MPLNDLEERRFPSETNFEEVAVALAAARLNLENVTARPFQITRHQALYNPIAYSQSKWLQEQRRQYRLLF
jgi:hypothetical protein